MTVTENCESLAQNVPHAAVVPGKTDARAALRREAGQLDKANDNIDATRVCQQRQRMRLGGAL